MNQLINDYDQLYSMESYIKKIITDAMHHTSTKEWMNIKEACNYIGVTYNTFMNYREMGLKVCEINGIKRVSKSEIDTFLNSYSY